MIKNQLRKIKKIIFNSNFSSSNYWEKRYAQGGDSGQGSSGHLAKFKADYINKIISEYSIKSICEWGSGDGRQTKMLNYDSYTGYDVSDTVIQACQEKFKNDNKTAFKNIAEYDGQKYDLSLSIDVIYHLIEDKIYEDYIDRLFQSSKNFVLIYSSNSTPKDCGEHPHIKHREFTKDVSKRFSKWKLIEIKKNDYPYNGDHTKTSFADFYLYSRVNKE